MTRRDFLDFFGKLPPQTIRGQVWDRDGELLAFAGYWLINGAAFVYSDIKPDIDVPQITIAREAIKFLADLHHHGVCVAQDENAERFLKFLGWVYEGPSDEGEVYSWQH